MAKVRLSHIVSEIKGKIGGSYFQDSVYGLVMKPSVRGLRKNTQKQATQKTNNNSVVQAWRNLTDAQRQVWKEFQYFYRDDSKLSETKLLGGYKLFIWTNQRRLISGIPITITPSAPILTTAVRGLTVDAFTSNNLIIVTIPGLIATNSRYDMYASKPLSPGVSSRKVKYKKLISGPSIVMNSSSIRAFYLHAHGALPPVGTKVFFRLRQRNSLRMNVVAEFIDETIAH